MIKEEARNEAMKNIGRALKKLSQSENEFLKELKGQIDEAVKADSSLDKQLEFCYGIIFAPDRIQNKFLIKSAREYIKIVEG